MRTSPRTTTPKPPTLNLVTPDTKCDLDCVPDAGRDVDAEFAISDSFGFGGINACVVVRCDDGHSQASAWARFVPNATRCYLSP